MSNYSPRLLLSIAQSLTLFIAFMLATTSYAFAGSISGKVTDNNGTPITNIQVNVQTFNTTFSFWEFVGAALTNNNGEYTISSLEANDYRVFINASNLGYPEYYYDGASLADDATIVSLAETEDKIDIDAQLTKQGIKGVISNTDGDLLQNVSVEAYQYQSFGGGDGFWVFRGSGFTNQIGEYEIGLNDGTYKIFAQNFNDSSYEYYQDAYNFDAAVDVVVGGGQVIANMTFGGEDLGSISGKVVDNEGLGIEATSVQIEYKNGSNWWSAATVLTDSEGNFTYQNAPPNEYRFRFINNEYVSEYYDNAFSQNDASSIVLALGEDKTDINVELEKSASLTGIINNASGDPLSNIEVSLLQFNPTFSFWETKGFGFTDQNGNYTINVKAGTYRLKAQDFQNNNGVEYYENKLDVDNATDIVLVGGQTSTINITFGDNDAGLITGLVTDSLGSGIQNIQVQLYIQNGTEWDFVDYFNSTDVDGKYTFNNLPVNNYRIEFGDQSSTYISEYYNDVTEFSSAETITVSANENKTDINAELAELGTVTGVITNANGDFLPNVNINLFQFDSLDGQWRSFIGASTDSSGAYTLNLKPNTYRLRANDNNGNGTEYYQDAFTIDGAEDIVITSGNETAIDMVLGDGEVGSISGVITDNFGNAIVNASLNASMVFADGSSEFISFVFADNDGTYTLGNLPAGNYRLQFFADNYISEYYNDTTEFSAAEIITISASENKTDINAQLGQQGFVTGVVKNGVDDLLVNVQISLYRYDDFNSRWNVYRNSNTNNLGIFRIGAEPGTYRLKVQDFFGGNGTEFHQDAFTIDSANDLIITSGNDTIIDMILGDGGVGSISGVITDNSDNTIPLSSAAVYIINTDGSQELLSFVNVDINGMYTLNNVPAGDYKVQFYGPGYLTEYYNDTVNFEDAELITLTASENKVGINAQLIKQGISGVVTDDEDRNVSYGSVDIFRYDSNSSTWLPFSFNRTNQSGYYAIGLPEGTYRLGVIDSNNFNNNNQYEFYRDATTIETAKDIVISEGTNKVIDVIIGAPDIVPDVDFSLDIDDDGSVAPLTDGLLVLRSLFGFSGDALVNGAIGGSATRTSPTDIQDYIQVGKDTEALDIDADGLVAPLTDGLLILRKLFGFSGDALINGATGTGASRSTAIEINGYLESLSP